MSAGIDWSERNWGLADDMVCRAGVDDFSDAGNPIDEDALKPRLQRDRRGRTRDAGTDEFDGHQTRLFIDIVKKDIAVIGLNGRTNDLNDFLDLFTHSPSLWSRSPCATPESANGPDRARLRA